MDLSIVIVSWNTKELVDQCLKSIYKETNKIKFEIFVVDNNSHDNTAEMVREKYPDVILIANKKNLGFAYANNQALKQSRGRYVLVLNPDTIILNNALDKAVETMNKEDDNTAILGARTYNKDKTQQKTVWSDPLLLSQIFLLTKIKYIFPKSKTIKKYRRTDFDYTKRAYVDQIQGSFMLIKNEVMKKLNYFDEKFFIWFEEVDLCYRTRNAGYKILYSPDVEIIHLGGESFKQVMTIKKQRMYNRSLFYYFKKNKPAWQYFVLRLFEIPSLLLAFLAGFIKRLK